MRQALLTGDRSQLSAQERVPRHRPGRAQHHRYAACLGLQPGSRLREALRLRRASARQACSTRPASSPAPTACASRCVCRSITGRARIHVAGAGAAALSGRRPASRPCWKAPSGRSSSSASTPTTISMRPCRTTRPPATLRSASRAPTTPSRSSRAQSFNNATGYSNPEVDTLFDKGRDAPTRGRAQGLLLQGAGDPRARPAGLDDPPAGADRRVERAAAQPMEGRELPMVASAYGWRSDEA